MQLASIPTRFLKVWGADAAGAYIRTVPVDSQIGIQDGAASYSTGFPPDTFTALGAGGTPPFGQDVNGAMNESTAWLQWMQAGGQSPFNSAFATAISGYPKGAVLASSIVQGVQWYSTVDDNSTDPDDPLTSSGWARAGVPAGTALPFFSTTVPGGYVAMNALTIGNASSNAGYASADALFLFVANWLAFSNTQCPILTSGGIASTRGANAVVDFAANKQLTLPNGKGLGFIGVDTMAGAASTFLSGVPVTIGNTTTPGSILGENLHTLTAAEIAAHLHAVFLKDNQHRHTFPMTINNNAVTDVVGGGAVNSNNQNTAFASSNITIGSVNGVANDNQTASTGGGGSHNTVERNMTVYWGQKL